METTCPKTDISLVLELRLEVRLGSRLGLELTKIRLNTFSVKRPFGQVY